MSLNFSRSFPSRFQSTGLASFEGRSVHASATRPSGDPVPATVSALRSPRSTTGNGGGDSWDELGAAAGSSFAAYADKSQLIEDAIIATTARNNLIVSRIPVFATGGARHHQVFD